MRLLVTNDDGVDSVGIQVLAAVLADRGHEVVVVAPEGDRSGTGASLGRFDPDTRLEARAVELPEARSVEAWALDAPPAMCVLAARLGGFGEAPEVVVSGINAGLNTGRAILHSGTVGAVLTGQNFGMSGLAVSVQADEPWRWETAAALAADVVGLLVDAPSRSALNLNVPALAPGEVKGIRWARLAPFGEVRAAMGGTDLSADDDGPDRRRLQMELEFSEHDFDPDSDQGLVRAGYASLTTIVGVAEAWPAGEGAAPAAPGGETEPALTQPGDLVGEVVPGAGLHPVHRVPDATTPGALRRPVVVM